MMVCWLMAEMKVVKNYAKFYINNGFDVIALRVTVLDIMMPIRADEILQNEFIPAIIRCRHELRLIHGFSVGGYLSARFRKFLGNDPTGHCGQMLATIRCTVWDSCVDADRAKIGISHTMFPKSPMLRNWFISYVDMHSKIFYNSCTKYWEEGNQFAYTKPFPVPALIFYSDDDPMSPVSMNKTMQESWESHGVDCKSRMWIGSGHVAHMKTYPIEYQSLLKEFLEENGLIKW
jgi:hypothetical protein